MKVSALNRRLMLPLFISGVLAVALTGIADYLLLRWVWLPGGGTAGHCVACVCCLLLAEETFVVCRTGLLIHYHARHTQAGLREFLVGNGAKQFEALQPYYRHVISRTLVQSLWRWFFVALFVVLPCGFIFLLGGFSLRVVLGVGCCLLSVVCCAVAALLLSMFLYDRLDK